ncbi:xylulose kinase [Paenibacillus darwinianus]|uniref:Xylulose kinase n=1 Tax=Paenibacillus darwinianus TaxID=1380763 RepID=A0A9W5S163_9BACL|nr:xylulokinase [Paenibacillus darwinianus]EXX86538.1 xylulose kinase [Paenibacillus darwinianus]EXX87247.1 xylulose kinase [Paenibacillus darwinianus]EXX87360.1 xylulose kinase [Paenibacillus darwinianus]
MSYVIGIDLGTSAVKALLIDREGRVRGEASQSYPLIHEHSGWSEQQPEDWVESTAAALQEVLRSSGLSREQVEGISFSGQMHGLVLLDADKKPVRNAILWNDTRTTAECREIERELGDTLLGVARNPALEGFTLPKILWVRKHEPEVFGLSASFLLPKDYVRFRLTGELYMDYSDAAGTLLFDVANRRWSEEILRAFDLPAGFCPPLVESHALVGVLLPGMAERTGLAAGTKVFAGGADNACGAIGAGILSEGLTLCSIGTSGVILTYENDKESDYAGKVHFFNHGQVDAYYAMGVTLAAGYSLSWFQNTFAPEESFGELLKGVGEVKPGAGGLLFTPYLVGERTPHADSQIRGSFIGVDGSHTRDHFARAVMEGITFSLAESVAVFRSAGKKVDRVVSIGGGAQNPVWLQMQADIFNAEVAALENEQGPGLGAAMLAAYGCGWFDSLAACADKFVKRASAYQPQPEAVKAYEGLFDIYRQVYAQTRGMNEALAAFRG